MDLPTPTAFFRMNAASGAAEVDTIGGISLASINGVTSVAGKVGNARSFAAASSQYLNAPDQPALRANAPASLAGWFSLSSKTADMFLINKGRNNANTDREYLLQYAFSSNYMAFYIFDGTGNFGFLNILSAPLAATWYCFCLKWDGTNIYSAINGGAFKSAAFGLPQGTTGDLMLGKNLGAGFAYYDGWLDAVGWWRGTALSDAQWQNFYNAGAGREFTNGYWG
jgi:hypothetical protein